MRSTVDVVVRLLEDGKVHSIREIEEEEKIPRSELDRVIRFLTKYGIIERVGNNIRIDPDFRALADISPARAPLLKRLAH